MSRMRIYGAYRIVVISVIFLSGCSNADKISEGSSPAYIIQADSQTLEQALERAHVLTLETGMPVSVRMSPRDNSGDVQKDQELAKNAIETRYGKSALLSVDPID